MTSKLVYFLSGAVYPIPLIPRFLEWSLSAHLKANSNNHVLHILIKKTFVYLAAVFHFLLYKVTI